MARSPERFLRHRRHRCVVWPWVGAARRPPIGRGSSRGFVPRGARRRDSGSIPPRAIRRPPGAISTPGRVRSRRCAGRWGDPAGGALARHGPCRRAASVSLRASYLGRRPLGARGIAAAGPACLLRVPPPGGCFPDPPACPSRARPGAASTLGTPLPGERGAPSARRAGLRARALVLPCARRSQEPPPACAGPERADWGAVTCERQPVFSTRAARRSPGATAPSGRDAVAYPNPQSPWQALASDPVPSLARARQPRSRAPSVACGAVLAGERPPRIRMCVAPATRSQRGRWRRRLGPWLFTSRGVPTTPATGELTSAHQTKAPPEPARSPGRYGKSRPVSPRRAPS
jgi:hypothetical protein